MIEHLQRVNWHPGQLLAFSGLDGPTDYDHGLVARTTGDGAALQLVHPGTCRLQFSPSGEGRFLIAGDTFSSETEEGRTRGAFLDAHHLLIHGPCEVSGVPPELTGIRDGDRTLVGTSTHFDAGRIQADLDAACSERLDWLASRSSPRGLPETSHRAFAKALSQMKGQVSTPEGAIHHRWTTPDRWPHRAMWLWDSAFHAIGWRHIDVRIARDAISAVLDIRREDGFIPHMIRPEGTSSVTQPPVLALAASLVDRSAPDEGWLGEICPALCGYVRWDMDHRDTDGAGLVEWHIEGNPHCRSGESGMDNSPRFDTATQLDAVDFNAFLALECEILAGFAQRLGRVTESESWGAEHRRLCDLINSRLWSEEAGFYLDYDVDRSEPSPVLASSGFLPLICGAASQAQAKCLAEHLTNPDTFGTALPVASVAQGNARHYAKDMWRGPVWINVNWLIAMGFERYGLRDAAGLIRDRSISVIESGIESYGTFFEFYDDRLEIDPPSLMRKGRCAPEESPYHQVFHDYGWTATLYVDMVLSRI